MILVESFYIVRLILKIQLINTGGLVQEIHTLSGEGI